MSIFSNPNQTSKGSNFAPRLQTPGPYHGCECIKFQKLPDGSKAVAVLEWKVPNNPATIQDFINNPTNDKAVDYIIGHAKELANAALGKDISADEEKDLAWAEKVFTKVARDHAKCDIILTIRSNPLGNDFTNARYVPLQSAVVVDEDDDDLDI